MGFRVLYLNFSVSKLWGLDWNAAQGKNLHELVPEFQDINKLDNRVYHINVKDKDFYVLSFGITNEASEPNIVFLVLNIYENKALRKELAFQKKLTEELEEILEGSFDGILVTDKDGNILYVNSSYERVAEIKCSEMRGKSMRDFINPVWMPNSVAYVVAEQKRPVSLRQVVKSGRHIIVTGQPIFDKRGEIKRIVINVRDITEIYELTEELQKSRQIGKMYLKNYTELEEYTEGQGDNLILAFSESMREVLSTARRVANFQTTVLIDGESGAGKEKVAEYIHQNSQRKNQAFVVLNCGAIPANLLEAELFGYEKGAFTGAGQAGKEGLLEIADGGTVFLDEIGETTLDFQVKMLRFMETKEVRRVGSTVSLTIDVRIIAATNRDLTQMVEEGSFREDFYYRLNVVQIHVPPLRKRTDDIIPLSILFLHYYNERYGQNKQFTQEVMRELEKHPWVGNVRQLKNIIENMVVISNNEYLQTEDLPWTLQELKNPSRKLINATMERDSMSLPEASEELEKLMLIRAMAFCKTTREISKFLQVNQSTVVRKMKKHGLRF
jgi:PAS domain S-box-containing protein